MKDSFIDLLIEKCQLDVSLKSPNLPDQKYPFAELTTSVRAGRPEECDGLWVQNTFVIPGLAAQ